MPDYDAFYDHLRPRAASCRARRSRRSATSSPSTSRCSSAATTSSRSTSPAASPAPCAPPSRRATRWSSAASTPARIVVIDSRTGCAGHGLMAIAAANAAKGGADVAGRRRRARATLRERDEDPVRRRHARVPAPRRPDRRRAGVARLGAEDQADPLDRERDPARRARAHRGAARSSGWSTTSQEQREEGADVFFIQHVQAPEHGRAAGRARPRDLRPRPRSSSPRSARSSAPTPARA